MQKFIIFFLCLFIGLINIFNKCEAVAVEFLFDEIDMAEVQKSMYMTNNSLDKLLKI